MINKIVKCLSLIWVFTFSLSAIAEQPKELVEAIKLHFKLSANQETPKFNFALVDLNNDGASDAIVFITDNNYCGSGGCSFQIYKKTKGGFELLSKGTLAKPPIRVSNNLSNGWKDLILFTGGGIGNVVLHFNGKGYPSNPSTQGKASEQEIKNSNIVISSYGN